MKRFIASLVAALFVCMGAAAQDVESFQGKTITMVVGFEAGGGTDVTGRLIAPYLAKYLPGTPTIVVQNRPGVDGVIASNYFVQQVKPDGLTIMMGASNLTDPVNFRKSYSKYDPTKFSYIGGIGRGGSAVIINRAAEKRLFDPQATPVIMGSPGAVPHFTMQATAWGKEFLGWNAKWVIGYRGTSDLFIALERGEIDMTATSNSLLINKLVQGGQFKVLVQTGTIDQGRIVGRSDFADVPVFAKLMEGKVKDPLQQRSYDYWYALLTIDKWLTLPPDTPAPIVAVYRDAFNKMIKDPEFIERGKKISADFETQAASDLEGLVKTLGDTTPEAYDFISTMLHRQGIGGG